MSVVSLAAANIGVAVSERAILRDVSIVVHAGELLGLIGPNGAGKSTLLRVLAGALAPTTGHVTLEGRALRSMRPVEIARVMAIVPQDTRLDFAFTVREVVLMGRHPHLGRFSVEGPHDIAIADEAMARAGVAAFADRAVTSLSGGERQLVFLAKALAQEPCVLLLDEPISALDIRHQLTMLDLIRDYTRAGAAAIAALHDLNLAARFCDRLALLANGEVVVTGAATEVLNAQSVRTTYRVQAAVRHDDAVGRKAVTALSARLVDARTPRIHVLAGGGSAAPTLTALYEANATVSVGPVEAHDPDATLARAFGFAVLTYPSFHPLSAAVLAEARRWIADADHLVVTPVPIGPNNAALQELLCDADAIAVAAPKEHTLTAWARGPIVPPDQLATLWSAALAV